MRSCDTCPGGSECAGDSLVPVLEEIYALYQSGVTNKFEILFALSDEAEVLFERYNDQVSRICWIKGALEVIAALLTPPGEINENNDPSVDQVRQTLAVSVKTFENFPWYVSGLIGQAPDLYDAICYRDTSDRFSALLSKRNFVKLCKDVVYQK